mmetsp:Transcript_90692/g.189595  ORF Transcript_90692/g.189595 Transcript_90692/m.189595 type:complete len:94 (+) Transcript_90692:109-390(+)|eukprot:CAMPEP_0206471482 /NCGR_PEP_ID=MMETSP0324_2-20121206/31589_1 /ASSEMBLY_ACC=CAM_ASM_000836 /TAXON_ID=2866 /ORGANISM="Crypthecodinium cohnii, Strain Seligo" /LENGTH=93 /DNA_ID=CAMNT_0053945815 /DNA_START=108 /DNA_END=389 /DNA_ORIENTATION=-
MEQQKAFHAGSDLLMLGAAAAIKQGSQQQPQRHPPKKPTGQVFVAWLMSPVTVQGQKHVLHTNPHPPGGAQQSHRPVDQPFSDAMMFFVLDEL